jgi:DNA-binding response OmpR family regulator
MSHSACLLILEDNPTEMAVFEMKLKRVLGPNDIFFGASSGQEAINLIQSREELDDRPCIFILDLNMPGELKGFDVLRWIRASAAYSGCAVVILTTSDAPEDRRRAEELGADRYYIKPKTTIEVTPLLRSILTEFRDSKPHDPLNDSMQLRIDRAQRSRGS